jgi:hypothetical protein
MTIKNNLITFNNILLITVARRPKILQNNSKPALEKSDWPEEFGGRTAAVFG